MDISKLTDAELEALDVVMDQFRAKKSAEAQLARKKKTQRR